MVKTWRSTKFQYCNVAEGLIQIFKQSVCVNLLKRSNTCIMSSEGTHLHCLILLTLYCWKLVLHVTTSRFHSCRKQKPRFHGIFSRLKLLNSLWKIKPSLDFFERLRFCETISRGSTRVQSLLPTKTLWYPWWCTV